MENRRRAAWGMTLVLLLAGCGDSDEPPARTGADPGRPAAEEAPASPPDTSSPADTAGAAPDTAGATSPAPTSRERARTSTVYTVQVGAFVEADNAEGLAARLEEEGLPHWRATASVEGRAFERVRVGATESLAEARELARTVGQRHDGPTWVAPVPPDVELPDGLIEATRALVERS